MVQKLVLNKAIIVVKLDVGFCCFGADSGGMNSQEAKKPDIVFDGELDFEKGAA